MFFEAEKLRFEVGRPAGLKRICQQLLFTQPVWTELSAIIASMRNERGGQSEIPYPENLLKAIENYKSGPPTPETVTAYWKAKMDFEGRKARRDIRVSQCTWNEREIQSPMFDIHGNPIEGMMVYVGKKFTKEDG